MSTYSEKQIRINQFLRKLYEKRIFYPPGIHFSEIAKELGFVDDTTKKELLPSLEHRKFITWATTVGKLIITLQGIDEVENQLQSDPGVIDIRLKRIRFLRRLNEIIDATGHYVDMYDLGAELAFDASFVDNIFFYLNEKGLIELHGLGTVIKITFRGTEELEKQSLGLQ